MPFCVFFFKKKTAYELRISDLSSDVCSSDLSTTVDLSCGYAPGAKEASAGLHIKRAMLLASESPQALSSMLAPSGFSQITFSMPDSPNCWPCKTGRASCRERVCLYVSIAVVAVSFKKKLEHYNHRHTK